MAELLNYFDRFSPLEKPAREALLENTKVKTFEKGAYLLKKGKICRHLYFIDQGLVKSSLVKGDKEFIMRFFNEDTLFSLFESYITQTPSKYSLIALEKTTVTLIGFDTMTGLCEKHHSVETFFRKLVSVAVVKMTKRIGEMLEDNATEHYRQFVEENNAILQRISLGDLAKYLGITQQSLSRIRAAK
jgi:CRP/FNR family transcriptional regulator, anaerobic regulatory protein